MKGPKVPDEVREVAEKLRLVSKKKPDPANWLLTCLDDLSKASPTKQCCVGAATGVVNGYIFGRVGKSAAVIVGGSLLLLQLAKHMGYIEVNWKAVEADLKNAKRELKHRDGMKYFLADAKDFLQQNGYLGGGFIAGFAVGLFSA